MNKLKKTMISFFTITAFSLLMVFSVTILDKGQDLGDVQFFSNVFAQSSDVGEDEDCATCPSSEILRMDAIQCSSGNWLARCVVGGSGCNVSGQTPATC